MQAVPTSAEPTARPSSFVESRAALVALLALVAAVLVAASLRPFSRSEIRYVEAGAEMVAGGDWVVPHLAYVPYFEKPIFAYWVEAAAQACFGAGFLAARLAAVVPGIAMTYLAYALGRSLRGPAFGLGAAALLASSLYFVGMSAVVTTDPLFSAWLVLAWYAFRRHDVDPISGWIWVFWSALGLAALTKGPLAFVLAGLSIGAYLLLAGRLRDAWKTRPLRGAAVVVAINLPWSLAVWARDPRFLEFFYVRQNFKAFFDDRVNHPGPVWFYVPYLVAAFFPFSLLAAWALGSELAATIGPATRRLLGRAGDAPPPDAGRLYVACMLAPPLLFFSVSSSKLGTYLLPLMPAAAIAVAWWIADRIERPSGMLRWATLAQSALLAAALPVAAHHVVRRPDVADKIAAGGWVLVAAAASIAVGCAVGSFAMARRRVVAGMAVAAAGTTAGLLFTVPAVESLASDADASPLVPKLLAARRAGERVILAGGCSEEYSVVFGLGERVAIAGPARELGMGHFVEVTPPPTPIPASPYDIGGPKCPLPDNPWILDDARLVGVWTGGARAWFVGRPSDVDRLRGTGVRTYVLAENAKRSIVTNQPLPAAR